MLNIKRRFLILSLIVIFLLVLPVSFSLSGKAIAIENQNKIQKAYQDSKPAVVKIFVYADYDFYLPNIEEIDLDDYYAKIEQDIEPTFDDVKITYDENKNFFEENEVMRESKDIFFGKDTSLSFGSGFIVNPDGYILTNAHVAALNEQQTAEEMKVGFLQELEQELNAQYETITEDTVEEYINSWVMYNFMSEHVEIRNVKLKTKVIVGVDNDETGTVSKEYDAKLIDSYLSDESVMDWAILKIDASDLPFLYLGDSSRSSIGDEMIVIGFPFVSEAGSTDFRTDVEPTLSTGYVSQIISSGNEKMFQVDVSLTNGNSGGPGLDINGDVIGIVTYRMKEYVGGQYNYVLRINDVKKMMDGDPVYLESSERIVPDLQSPSVTTTTTSTAITSTTLRSTSITQPQQTTLPQPSRPSSMNTIMIGMWAAAVAIILAIILLLVVLIKQVKSGKQEYEQQVEQNNLNNMQNR